VPKIKTHKATQRRFKVTGGGKLMHSKIGKSHFRRRKPPRVKRQYSSDVVVHATNRRRVSRLLPYA
jgi:large subunit ribosomal protein L35